jgi:hypothetical protein
VINCKKQLRGHPQVISQGEQTGKLIGKLQKCFG